MPAYRPLPLTAFRCVAWALGLWPAAELVWRLTHAGLGANPVEFIEHHTGIWALRLLLIALAMTPLSRITQRGEFVQVRRLLGLWAFAWACVHFSTYLTFDLEWSAAQLAEDLIERTWITLGFSAWLLLLVLAITSTPGWQRRLARRWKQLHWLVYPAALLDGLHFLWLVKSDVREPLIYLGIAAVLLLVRVPWRSLLRRGAETGQART